MSVIRCPLSDNRQPITVRSEWLGHFQPTLFPLSALSFVPQAPQKDVATIGAKKETNRLLGKKTVKPTTENQQQKTDIRQQTTDNRQPTTDNRQPTTDMLYTALIFGLLSSFHCIGMCGPIAMMIPVDRNNAAKRVFQLFLYHLGRLTAYGMLGLFFGILGKGLFLAGFQQQLSILVGVLMILFVIVPEKKMAQYNFSKPIYKLISKVKSHLGAQFKKKTFDALFTIGLLNGFLPCGMVYAALFGAIAMQNEWLGASYMILFGIGTIPMMSAVVLISNFITVPVRNKIQKFIPIIVIIIGGLFIIRGMGLDIPYISPKTTNLIVQANPDCH